MTKKKPAAAAKKPAPAKKKRGAPTKYDSAVHPLKAWILAQAGGGNKEIAKGLRISTATLDAWQKKFPEFLSALQEGKEVTDTKVIKSVLRSALGFRTTEKRIIQFPDGTTRKEIIDREVPGNPIAQKTWLYNRLPNDWKERRALSGDEGGIPIPVKIYLPDNKRGPAT